MFDGASWVAVVIFAIAAAMSSRKEQVRLEVCDGRWKKCCRLSFQVGLNPDSVLTRFERSQWLEQFIPVARITAMADYQLESRPLFGR